MIKETKIRFKDLSVPLKVAIVIAWFEAIVYSVAFIIGFLSAFI